MREYIVRCHNRIFGRVVVAVLFLAGIFVCDRSFAEVSYSCTVCRDSPLEVDKVSAVCGDYNLIPSLLGNDLDRTVFQCVHKEIERHIIFGQNIR